MNVLHRVFTDFAKDLIACGSYNPRSLGDHSARSKNAL
jgi:hypothetical protein